MSDTDPAAPSRAGSPEGSSGPGLEMFLDVPVEVTVELGRRRLPIRELLELSRGATIELGKVAGELLDVRVNGKLVARGEAVVVNDKFGVRLTELVGRR